MDPKVKQAHKRALYAAQRERCAGCGDWFAAYDLTIDHIEARSRGGTDERSNLQLLCFLCNKAKGDGSMGALLSLIAENRARLNSKWCSAAEADR